MRKLPISLLLLLLLSSCSPRDFLTRRLAADLIANSALFRTAQPFQLRIGPVSASEYPSPQSTTLLHRGWLTATPLPCPPALSPPPCWDLTLTPAGVETFQPLIPTADAENKSFTLPAARRQLLEITGISKDGNFAQVDFLWRWLPLNEPGAALYQSDQRYLSTVSFRRYDDGWRLLLATPHPPPSLDESLQNPLPAQ